MSLAAQLYRLQQLDLELQEEQQELTEIEDQLSDNKALVAAESRLASQTQQLQDARKRQKTCEWELEDLQEKIRQIDGKLYSGKTKDPKELVNLEKEVKGLRSQIKTKEDALLGLMSQVEEIEATARAITGEIEQLKREWAQTQEVATPRKDDTEAAIAELKEERNRSAAQINSEALGTYDRIRLTTGQAVAKVEKGRCLGCHITVPTSQWQRVRAGDLIQCNNCGKILYLE